ncbi:uncharacterized protein PAC_02361 [Phialocephala subalpina]|uniref:CorA-like transporter domain-containing protein n=1 Tax=Phialocephala subalpina TaxID=576137 RepID=A0A1L7WI84_9HELO|nr:uncharacterized protein PAC_02361 [Phialocephala subalpina]
MTNNDIFRDLFNKFNAERLFYNEEKTDVELWEYKDHASGFVSRRSANHMDLRNHLVGAQLFAQVDPECRFVYEKSSGLNGVYHETRLTDYQPHFELRDLGRSSHDFQLCYNLKSVELSDGQLRIPWSVRILAVYHRFDVITGLIFWTIVKGDELTKRRIKAATSAGNQSSPELGNPSQAFSLILDTQLIIFGRCREKWRRYISYLEDLQDATTRRAITTSFDRLSGQKSMDPPIPTAATSPGMIKRNLTPLGPNIVGRKDQRDSARDQVKHQDRHRHQAVLHGPRLLPDFPDDIKNGSLTKLKEFEITVASIINDLETQYSRADTLLSTLTNRKGLVSASPLPHLTSLTLLNGILDYRNTEASKSFAEKAEASTREMQNMTEEMKELTQKTKQETESMRIITLVTLFFLPGTFIWTIMSSDILQHSKIDETNKFEEDYSSEALKRYVEITVPLMAITSTAWYFVYLWVDKREDVKALKRRFEAKWSSDHKA